MLSKEIFSFIAIALTFASFIPYIHSIKQGKTKPHVFSWIIWGTCTFVVFLAQVAGNAGAGAWPVGISALFTFYTAYLAYRCRNEINVTRSDRILFIIAMLAIPCWYITSDPVWAVLILTTVDIIGFIPTIRKTYHHPYQERLLAFWIIIIRNMFVLAAIEHYSLTTALFPIAISGASFAVIMVALFWRYTKPSHR